MEMAFGGSRLAFKDGMLKDVCRLQSLLLQFIHPRVREDFLNGLLGMEGSQDLLSDLDLIRRIAIPPWRGRSVVTMQLQLDCTAGHLDKLPHHSSDNFDLQSSTSRTWTYKDWADFLSALATSTYWGVTDQEAICINHLTVPTSASDLLQSDAQKSKISGDLEKFKSDNHPNQNQSVKSSFKDPVQIDDHQQPPKIIQFTSLPKEIFRARFSRIETISLSDSSTENDGTSSGSSSSSGSSHRRRRRRKHSQREIVRPLPFEMNGFISLKSFFSTYERYFAAKFEGNSRDCTQELKHFLPDEMEQYYDALGGRRLKYKNMKAELLKWYKARKRGGARYWREQLRDTEMRPGEELRLYGMRLLEIGQKAYPDSDRECVKEVKYHYLNSVPKAFADYVRQSEQMIRVVDRERKLKWADIMKLAEDEDDQREKIGGPRKQESTTPRVWYSREETETKQWQNGKQNRKKLDRNSDNVPAYASRMFTSRRSSPPAGKATTSKPSCQWCGRSGHSLHDCWRKKGACIICGDTFHSKDECSRFQFRNSATRQPTCPICQGNHLGMHCKASN